MPLFWDRQCKLRNEHHCAAWYPWVKLGLFRKDARNDLDGMTYGGFMRNVLGTAGNPKSTLSTKLGLSGSAPAIANLEWLGMFSDEPLPIAQGSNMDVLATRMLEKCGYDDGERDMIVMQHEFLVRYDNRDEHVFSTLVEYGTPGGDSAMARTVGLPLAIATRMVRISERGVVTPVKPEIYNPILDELEGVGISFDDRVE